MLCAFSSKELGLLLQETAVAQSAVAHSAVAHSVPTCSFSAVQWLSWSLKVGTVEDAADIAS